MTPHPWTIDTIRDALGHPDLSQRFTDEIHHTQAHELLTVFTKWKNIAQRAQEAVEQGRKDAAAIAQGKEPPGNWIDATHRIQHPLNRDRPS